MKTFKTLREASFQRFHDDKPNWGEDKALSYGRKKGYKEVGVCGYGKIDGIVLFGLDAGDKAYVGKEAKVKTGQTVFRYATSRTVAGDIFPLVKIDTQKGLLYHLSQKSSEGEIEHAEFETKSVKLRYLRTLPSLKESVELVSDIAEAVEDWTVTVAKPVNKLKKGASQSVKARSAFEAINKAVKLWGDPALKSAPINSFKITKESVEEGKKPVSQMTPAEKKADAERRKEYNAYKKSKRESLDLEEGKMKDFHDMVKKGMTAAQIAKKIGMKEKDVADFMKGMNEAKEMSYTVVHAKKGKVVVTAPTSYDAAQKAAKQWKLKSTAGVDSYLMKESVELDFSALRDKLNK